MRKSIIKSFLETTYESIFKLNTKPLVEDEYVYKNDLLFAVIDTFGYLISRDGEGRINRASEGISSKLKIKDYTGKTVDQIIRIADNHEQLLKFTEESDRITWESKQKFQLQTSLMLGGNSATFDVVKIPIFNPDHSRREILTFLFDITAQKEMENKLRKSENRLAYAQKMVQTGNWDWDLVNRKIHWSDELFHIHGIEKSSSFSLDDLKQSLHPEDAVEVFRFFGDMINGDQASSEIEYRIIRGAGEVRTLLGRAEVITDESGKAEELLGIVQDITEKKAIQDKLRESELIYRSLVTEALVGVIILQNGKLTYANPYIIHKTGYSESDLLQMDVLQLLSPEYRDAMRDRISDIVNGYPQNSSERIKLIQKDGQLMDVEVYVKLLILGGIPSLVGTLVDITDEVRASAELHQLAFYDYLTGLPNRRYLENELTDTIKSTNKKQSKIAVMQLGLDRFKYVNETLGYSYGDELLKMAANRISSCIGAGNTILSRIGEDNFTVIVRDLKNEKQVKVLSANILKEIQKPFYIDQYELFLTTSIGISIFPSDGNDGGTLLKNADIALARAKENGKNNYQFYTSSMNVNTFRIFSLEKGLRKAISNEEFEIYYQPKVCPRSGTILGAEALIRWNHPEWGIVSPAEFIPLAEETGLILPIGDWISRTVCEHLSKWDRLGLKKVPVSINISPKSFLERDYVSNLHDTLQTFGVHGKWIELEITESVFLQHEESIQDTMAELKNLGIRMALDDFGTGYSSLSYLTRFPIDILKIDRSFMKEVTAANSKEKSITQAIIQMAKSLNMTIVAEGVETLDQLQFLKEHLCDQVQGYIFSRAVPEHEFIMLLSRGTLPPKEAKSESGLHGKDRKAGKRSYFTPPLHADMTIVKIKGEDIKLGVTEVAIKEIDINDLHFVSTLSLPVSRDFMIQIRAKLLDRTFRFKGNIVFKNELEDINEYGLVFDLHNNDRTLLNQCLIGLKPD
ncbi:EAL domain-containing protein [Paenibacillus chitinolyticus]|uniref:sensor domain-containing protein n=1 Tax=Paenibacillus chitinolyticus TaxID=79263 RepID=UPI00386FAF57